MGTTIANQKSARGKRRQVKRQRRNGFSDRKQARFFDALAETSNIAMSARVAGVSEVTIYRFRREAPGFAARFEAALDEGYSRLELIMLEQALGGTHRDDDDSGDETAGGRTASGIRPLTNSERMRLLKLHRDKVQIHRAKAMAFAEESPEEIRAGIERKLREMRARLLGEDNAADREQGEEQGADACGGDD